MYANEQLRVCFYVLIRYSLLFSSEIRRGDYSTIFTEPEANNCWRALARQLPILYDSEKKAKSVGCKIEGMRSRLCFISGHFRVLVNVRGN